jgi:tRNA(Ile)-lysidine synthase
MSNQIQHTLREFLLAHRIKDQKVVAGVSGGADSLAMLHGLRELALPFGIEIHAAHLNHQLRGNESEADARFVEDVARTWDIPLTVESHDVEAFARAKKLSLEEAARMVRYGFLEQVAEREGAAGVAVAHHADDQVETIVMHFLRGAGLAGLRGMQPVSRYPFRAPLLLLRPLLEASRMDIDAYCAEHHIDIRVDSTNRDTQILRNRLRHELLPLLEQVNPNLREVLRRNARIIADDYAYIGQRVDGAWQRTVLEESQEGVSFSLSGWRTLQPALKRALIRMAVMRLRPALRTLDAQHVERALHLSNRGQAGCRATLPAGLWLFREFDAIVIGEKLSQPVIPLAPAHSVQLAAPGETHLPHGWVVESHIAERAVLPADALQGIDPYEAFLDADKSGTNLSVRACKTGDEFRPLGLGGHSKSLRRFLIDAKVPSTWRERTPLIMAQDEVLWVVGWRIAERVKVDEQTQRVLQLRVVRTMKDEREIHVS